MRSAYHVRNPAIAAAIDDAVMRGDRRLFDLLCRGSGLPGPRPNHALAQAAGRQIASLGRRADALVGELCAFDIRRAPAGTPMEMLPIVGAMALARRYASGDRPEEALDSLRTLAEDPRHVVRDGVSVALCEAAAARGDSVAADLGSWMDGYLPAAVAIEALTSRRALDRLRRADLLVEILDRAFSLVEGAARADQRSQGYRTLLETLPLASARAINRFPAAIDWLEIRATTGSPDLRRAIEKLSEHGIGRSESVEQALAKSAKPRRDPRTYVGPTRQRGSKRRNSSR
jgi:hypothetical protein